MALKPYDINSLAVGSVRVLFAPTSVAAPTNIKDIIAMVSPYAPFTGFVDFGAAKSSTTYKRGFDTSGIEIEQVQGNVIESVSDVTRSIATSVSEINPVNQKLLEEGSLADEVIAAAAGKGAQTGVPVGSNTLSLTRRRIAFVGVRDTASGIVTEPGGATRGRMFALVLWTATLSADSIEMEFDKGALAEAKVEFTAFPDSTAAAGKEHGDWFFEAAGTIT